MESTLNAIENIAEFGSQMSAGLSVAFEAATTDFTPEEAWGLIRLADKNPELLYHLCKTVPPIVLELAAQEMKAGNEVEAKTIIRVYLPRKHQPKDVLVPVNPAMFVNMVDMETMNMPQSFGISNERYEELSLLVKPILEKFFDTACGCPDCREKRKAKGEAEGEAFHNSHVI